MTNFCLQMLNIDIFDDHSGRIKLIGPNATLSLRVWDHCFRPIYEESMNLKVKIPCPRRTLFFKKSCLNVVIIFLRLGCDKKFRNVFLLFKKIQKCYKKTRKLFWCCCCCYDDLHFCLRPCASGKFPLRPYQNNYGNWRL